MNIVTILVVLVTFCLVNSEDTVVQSYTEHITSRILSKKHHGKRIPQGRSESSKNNAICTMPKVFSECGSACPAYCNDEFESPLCIALCVTGCFCPPDMVLLEEDGDVCVESSECPDVVTGYPQVNTTSGLATGITTNETHTFYEIPYAQPPIKELRFQPPNPILIPQDINATTNHFIQCYQPSEACENTPLDDCQINMKENCLILNIFTPNTINLTSSSYPPTERLPVMFYIHGGSFKTGSASQRHYDGKTLARYTNTVVVVINYRLGPFGFLMHKQTDQSDIQGNQGLKDQQLAMKWVQDNIAKFGGDKAKVTIFGNSAGAQSIMFHTLSEKSKDLYSNAIQQSNPSIFSFVTPGPDISLRITDRLIKSLDCDSTDERYCLMNSQPSDIINQISNVENQTAIEEDKAVYGVETFQPVLDGEEFTDQPMNLYRDGKWNKNKEMIFGVATQELEDLQFYFPKEYVYDEQAFLESNKRYFDSKTSAKIVEKYKLEFPPPDGEDYRKTFGIELSHYYFDCASRLMARYASNSSTSSVHFYANEHPILVEPCVVINNGNTTDCYLATHTAELRYVMRTVDQLGDVSAEDNSVQNQFSFYWANFARTGNPNTKLTDDMSNFPNWPEYKSTIGDGANESWHHIQIKAPTSEEQFGYKENICDFWDDIEYGLKSDDNEATTTAPVSTTSKGHTIELPTLNLMLWLSLCFIHLL